MTKLVFKIANIHYTACAMTIDGIEDELPGARQVSGQ